MEEQLKASERERGENKEESETNTVRRHTRTQSSLSTDSSYRNREIYSLQFVIISKEIIIVKKPLPRNL